MQFSRRIAAFHTLNPLKELQIASFQNGLQHEQKRGMKLFEVSINFLTFLW
jgi:hypothetical protein